MVTRQGEVKIPMDLGTWTHGRHAWKRFERYTCWGGQSAWPIISPVAARHQCNRFPRSIHEDLGDTEVDEGGDTADLRESTAGLRESGRLRLVLVSQQEVAPTVMDAISRDLHAESIVESIPVRF